MLVGSKEKHIIVVCRCTHLLPLFRTEKLHHTEYFAIMLMSFSAISCCFTVKTIGAEIHCEAVIHYR